MSSPCRLRWLAAFVYTTCLLLPGVLSQAPLNGLHTRVFVDLPQTNITVLGHSGVTAFGTAFYTGARAAANLLNVTVFGAVPDLSQTISLLTQVVRMNDAFNQNTGAIVATIPDPVIVGLPIKAAAAAGMPMFTANSGYDVAPGLGVVSHVGQNETAAGYIVGKAMLASGKTNPVCVLSDLQNVGVNQRCTGMYAAFNEHLGTSYSLTPGSLNVALTGSIYQYTTQAVATITSFLDSNPAVDCVMSATSSVFPTVLQALAAAQPRSVTPYHACLDLTYSLVGSVNANTAQMVINQNAYLQGFLPVMYAWPYLMVNETVSSQYVPSGPVAVTASNLAAQNATLAMSGIVNLNTTGRRAYVILHSQSLIASDIGMVKGLTDMAALSKYNLTFAPRTEYALSNYTGYVTAALAGCTSNAATCPHALIVSNAEPAFVNFARTSAAAASVPLFVIGTSGAANDTSGTFYVGADDFAMGASAAAVLQKAGVRKPMCVIHDSVAATHPQRCAGAASVFPNMPAPVWVDGFDTNAAVFALSTAVTSDIDGFVCASENSCDGAIAYISSSYGRRMPIVSVGHNTNTLISLANGVVQAIVDLKPYAAGFLTLGHVVVQLDAVSQVIAKPLPVGGNLRTYACPRGYRVNRDPALPLYQAMPSGHAGLGQLCVPCDVGTYSAADNSLQCSQPPLGYYVSGPPGQYSLKSCNDTAGATQAQCKAYFSTQETPTSTGVVYALYIIAGTLMAAILAVMVLIWVYRKTPTIKRASPVFSELICFGGLMGCASVFFMFGATAAGCMAFITLLSISYGLTLGSLLMKNYRLYKLFNTFRKSYKFSDRLLAVYVGSVVAVEALLLIVWGSIDTPSHRTFQNAIQTYGVCSSANPVVQNTFQSLLIAYNGLLLVAGLVLAVKSRSLSGEYAESKYIAMSSYQVTLCAVLGLGAANATTMDISFRNAIVGMTILVGFASTVFVMFGPRLFTLIRQSQDNKTEAKLTATTNSQLDQGNKAVQRTATLLKSAAGAQGRSITATVSFKGSGFMAAFERRTAQLSHDDAGVVFVHVKAPGASGMGMSFSVASDAFKWRTGRAEGSIEFYNGRHNLVMQFANDDDLQLWQARLPASQGSKTNTQITSVKKATSASARADGKGGAEAE
ncbi:hypothetical protein RI367_007925 [Sorochytrium milnesiophthora]